MGQKKKTGEKRRNEAVDESPQNVVKKHKKEQENRAHSVSSKEWNVGIKHPKCTEEECEVFSLCCNLYVGVFSRFASTNNF